MESVVSSIKREMFSQKNKKNSLMFVCPTAYDTAWLAMIEDYNQQQLEKRPLFTYCLDWILKNQKGRGFWGESYPDGFPTIDSLPTTLACILALEKWKVGSQNVEKGIAFIHAAVEVLLLEYNISSHLPRWFIITFPAMLQLARSTGLNLTFSEPVEAFVSDVSLKRQQILERNDEIQFHPPLLSYLEVLSSTVSTQHEIVKQLSKDGTLFQSPSATASAYILTGNTNCLAYLKAYVKRCSNGETTFGTVDEKELVQLCLVDQIQRLGLAEYFTKEIEDILSQIYKNLRNHQGSRPEEDRNVAKKLYKDALTFRLLRLQGYAIQQRSFCWFLQHADILNYMEEECENLKSLLYNVYRATDVVFPGESDVEKARQFSKKLLQKSVELNCSSFDDLVMFSNNPQNTIKHELDVPWISRLDHLDHRMWIEDVRGPALWIGNVSFYGFSWVRNEKLMQLAYQNFELRQSTYRKELNELNRWSKEKGLNNMGFGREKTLYSYFATAASFYFPAHSVIRMICAKCSIAITVADDYYDEQGSMRDLQILTEAIQKWNGNDLTGHGKTIFDAVDDIVRFVSSNTGSSQDGCTVETTLQNIWRETFSAWMTERTWSESGYVPSMKEYLEVGSISIAAHVIVLSAAYLLDPSVSIAAIKPPQYPEITNLLMTSCRLLNDMQSYQKEQKQGKINYVLLYMKAKPGVAVNDAIEEVKRITDEKRKALLEIALIDVDNGNKKLKQLHLSCLKVFSMFFNSSNLFDTKTDLLNDINKAIYVPLDHHEEDESASLSPKSPSKQILGTLPLAEFSVQRKKKTFGISALPCYKNGNLKYKILGPKKTTLFNVGDGIFNNCARPTAAMTINNLSLVTTSYSMFK